MSKKKWERPKLIVLVRGSPEEMALANCKGTVLTGPGTVWQGCGPAQFIICFGCISQGAT